MKKEDFFDILGDLDDGIVEDAKAPGKKRALWTVLGAMAACAILAASAVLYVQSTTVRDSHANGVTMAHIEVVQVQIEYWQFQGFVGTVVVGNDVFSRGERVTVTFQANVTVIQQDGSYFEYDAEDPNAGACDLDVGSLVWVGFQSYEYTAGSTHNRIYAYHIELNEINLGELVPEPLPS